MPAIIKETVLLLGDPVNLARVEIRSGTAIVPAQRADLASITRKIYSNGSLLSTLALNKASAFYDTLQVNTSPNRPIWTVDSLGFNFEDTLLHTALPTAGDYRILYLFVLTGGTQFPLWYEYTVKDPSQP